MSKSTCPKVQGWLDATAARSGAPQSVRGALNWAKGAVLFGHLLQRATVCLVDGALGVAFAPGGRLNRVLRFTLRNDKITEFEIIADPARLASLEIAVLLE